MTRSGRWWSYDFTLFLVFNWVNWSPATVTGAVAVCDLALNMLRNKTEWNEIIRKLTGFVQNWRKNMEHQKNKKNRPNLEQSIKSFKHLECASIQQHPSIGLFSDRHPLTVWATCVLIPNKQYTRPVKSDLMRNIAKLSANDYWFWYDIRN